MIAQQRFRKDLYYRLNGLVVKLPPLRERTDLGAVIESMLEREGAAAGGRRLRVAPDVTALFGRCAWLGNFRQLGNLLRTAALMVDDDGEIRREHLPDDFFDDIDAPPRAQTAVSNTPSGTRAPHSRLHDVAMSAIAAAIEQHGGNVSAAARALGVSRTTIYRKMPATFRR